MKPKSILFGTRRVGYVDASERRHFASDGRRVGALAAQRGGECEYCLTGWRRSALQQKNGY